MSQSFERAEFNSPAPPAPPYAEGESSKANEPATLEPALEPMTERKRLGEVLVDAGTITPNELSIVLRRQEEDPGRKRLGQVIVDSGFATEDAIARALAVQLNLPYVDLQSVIADPDVMTLVPKNIAERHQLVPIRRKQDELTVAMADPTNLIAIDDVRTASGIQVVVIAVANLSAVPEAIDRLYAVELTATNLLDRFGVAAEIEVLPGEADVSLGDDAEELHRSAQRAPIVRLVNAMMADAVRARATDVHIEPQTHEVKVRYRVDGLLRDVLTIPKHMQALVISRLKIISNMDIAERRRPQDGRTKIIVAGREIDARVSTIPTLAGEKVVIRLLDQDEEVIGLERLGFEPDQMSMVSRSLAQPQGLVVFTGPTGAGKTSTMYAGLMAMASAEKNVVTIEDPIEYELPGMNQMPVDERTGVTFAKGLRSILRQDPDVIMIGEIRDLETAQIAMQASLTGHLVLTSLHTNDAFSAVTRLVDLGVEPFRVAAALTLVIAQRLVRRVCDHCARPAEPSEKTLIEMNLNPSDLIGVKLLRGEGCDHCQYTGYRGRIGIYEVLPVSQRLRDQLATQVTDMSLTQAVRGSSSLVGLREAGLLKVKQGITTLEEVMRVTHVDVEPAPKCPACHHEVDPAFVVCPYCQHDLSTPKCRNCAREVEADWKICPYCRAELPASGAGTERPRILVVDDDPSLRLLAETIFSNDYEVSVAKTGEEGVKRATIERPDLIILDYQLPDILGTDVARRLRNSAQTSLIPLIMLTGYGGGDLEVEALRSGVDDYVEKPFDENALKARMEAALRKSGARLGRSPA